MPGLAPPQSLNLPKVIFDPGDTFRYLKSDKSTLTLSRWWPGFSIRTEQVRKSHRKILSKIGAIQEKNTSRAPFMDLVSAPELSLHELLIDQE